MKQHAFIKKVILTSTALFVGASTGLFAGEPAPYMAPPAPPADCSGCLDPGFFVEGSFLYMNSYRSGSSGYEGEWDLGFRGEVGFENQSGLFGKVTGFYYGGDYDLDSPGFSGEVDFYYVDALIGDTIHCGELCVAIAGGLRYGGFEDVEKRSGQAIVRSYEFDGWGPVIEIAAERALSERLSLYVELSQSILFGEAESGALQQASSTTDTLAAITEIEAGLQLSFGLGPVQNAFIRVGFEGHYWHIDSANTGLWGGVLSIGGTF